MTIHTGPRPLRVVIDTNVVLSALLFKSGAMAPIRDALQRGACVPLVSRDTAEELIRVLAYPKFELDTAQQQTILAEYLPHCETLPQPKTRTKLPKCRDEDDQPFLLLAAASGADVLVTGDKDLLALQGQVKFRILSPGEFLTLIEPGK